ncbi:uncharacterized protein G2W53_015260 [Senna tora]|uniref:Uncharacterized protein n=1 Tax=Senna tora TaxID=362788 RepID=A0A834WV78_9FABA|nr:uncharacterized protein G2W53_015260 [Senna tora]
MEEVTQTDLFALYLGIREDLTLEWGSSPHERCVK